MPLDLRQGYDDVSSKINAYKTTIATQTNEKLLKKIASSGNNLELKKSDVLKTLNDLGDTKQRVGTEIKNQFEELIDLFKASIPSSPNSDNQGISFLLEQVLGAAQNTKSRISEIFIEEALKTAGCSQSQTFDGNDSNSSNNKLYIRVNQIDLFNLLKKNPDEGNNNILYEKNNTSNGELPYSMDKELYNRIQNEGVSFSDEYGSDYIGASNNQIMDVKYVTSYVSNGTTYYGDYIEVSLRNRPDLNRVSDFLRDYYNSIDMLNFDDLTAKIMNSLTKFIDISAKVTTSEKEIKSKFEKILQRILGLCFDNTKEIDVSGNSKMSALDSLDDSFFELSPVDLRNIEIEINNMVEGVTEFEDCGNVKLPVNVESLTDSINYVRDLPESQKVEGFINEIEKLSQDENWKLTLPDGINVDIAIKGDILKLIPRSVVMTMLSPKVLLGFMIVLKSLGNTIMDEIEDFTTFMNNMRSFMVNMVSKIGSIFIEELFKLLKVNIRKLVSTLLIDIVKEKANAKIKIITGVLYILIQLASLAVDWRQCKSVVDELLNLLNLSISGAGSVIPGANSIPTFVTASTFLLPGFSPTRAMTNVTENLQKLGLPTGDLPDGSPNLMNAAIFQQIKGVNDEKLTNGKTETWCAPVAVTALGAGITAPIKCTGKDY